MARRAGRGQPPLQGPPLLRRSFQASPFGGGAEQSEAEGGRGRRFARGSTPLSRLRRQLPLSSEETGSIPLPLFAKAPYPPVPSSSPNQARLRWALIWCLWGRLCCGAAFKPPPLGEVPAKQAEGAKSAVKPSGTLRKCGFAVTPQSRFACQLPPRGRLLPPPLTGAYHPFPPADCDVLSEKTIFCAGYACKRARNPV